MPKEYGNRSTWNWMMIGGVLGFIMLAATLFIVSVIVYKVNVGQSSEGVVNVQPISAADNATGGPLNPCVWRSTGYVDGDTTKQTFIDYPKMRGTPCWDQCVIAGTCSGSDRMDPAPDGSQKDQPFCNATTLAACRGTCAVYTDCPALNLIGGLSTQEFNFCFGGTCTYFVDVEFDGSTTNPNTIFLPTGDQDDTNYFGPDGAVCKYVLLDNTIDSPTSKDCLDTGWFTFNSGSYDKICFYQYACNRPNFVGTTFNTISVTSINSLDAITIDVPPQLAAFFANATTTPQIKAAIAASVAYVRANPGVLTPTIQSVPQDNSTNPEEGGGGSGEGGQKRSLIPIGQKHVPKVTVKIEKDNSVKVQNVNTPKTKPVTIKGISGKKTPSSKKVANGGHASD